MIKVFASFRISINTSLLTILTNISCVKYSGIFQKRNGVMWNLRGIIHVWYNASIIDKSTCQKQQAHIIHCSYVHQCSTGNRYGVFRRKWCPRRQSYTIFYMEIFYHVKEVWYWHCFCHPPHCVEKLIATKLLKKIITAEYLKHFMH